jgi:hypothetical protein
MPDDCDEHNDVVAAGTSCPMPDRGTLLVAYSSPDRTRCDHGRPWEFACPRCGIDFTVPEDELLFHSVPKDLLMAKVHAA